MCMRPDRHSRQNPQNKWPSAETNEPGSMWWTSGPVATTVPATSWPNVIGSVWMRPAAQ